MSVYDDMKDLYDFDTGLVFVKHYIFLFLINPIKTFFYWKKKKPPFIGGF